MKTDNTDLKNKTLASGLRSNLLLLHLGAIIAVGAWGASFVMTKVLLDNGLGPVESYAYRILLAYLLMLLLSHNRLLARSLRDEVLFVVCGMCAGSIYFIAENTALQYTLTSNVSLITTTAPLITAMLAGAIYKSERPGKGMYIGSLVALLGVALVIFNSSMDLQVNPLGDFLALAAAFSWAVYSLVVRKLNATYDVMFITRKMFFYGLITTLPFMFFQADPFDFEVLKNPLVWGNLLALGVVCSIICFLVWNEAIKRLGTVTTSNYLYFQPVVTLVMSYIVLGEHITIVGYTGCGLILLGVYLSDYLSKARKA